MEPVPGFSFGEMALQTLHSVSQGGEEIFECTGDEEDQRILNEYKALDRLSNYRELVRAKTDPHFDPNSFISTQTLSPSEAFEVFQGRKLILFLRQLKQCSIKEQSDNNYALPKCLR